MIADAVYVKGRVAVRYAQPIPKLIQIGSERYYFDCQYGVSLAFVDEADVPTLLNHKGGCCGGQKLVITLASPAVYSHWLDGKGGR
jgi:hypothetical protein